MTTVARVVLDSPLPQLDRLFDYRVPAELEDDCVAGVRVKVPLRTGARMSDGYVVEIVTEGEYPGELSQIEAVLSPVPVLAPEIWTLARAVADRAAGVASDVLRLAVPPRQVRAEKAWLARDTAWSPPPVTAPPVTGYADGVLEAVVTEHGRAAVAAVPQPVAVGDADAPVWVPGWAATLAQAAAHTVAAEQSAVIAVPDFRDVIDLERALLAVLPPERVVRFDAKQTNGQRAKALLQARTHPVVAIGNRTAMYAPATALGLIAMWDDGDASFIEQRAPYVHTRDVALVRAAQSGAALLFVSHARSTDVQRLVELHWLQDVVPYRVKTPKVIPTVQQTGAEGFAAQARIPSSAWR
ncbi:primosomal protein N', partial [Curtobacterium flaccumfaciens]|nr:primosomal protein N' [Curtobacterium flaccumfaciens]MDO3698370.1 primosomal protein N' [Curtobacterium flaccumfaciens]